MPLQYPQTSPYNPYIEMKKPTNWLKIILIILGIVIIIGLGAYFIVNPDIFTKNSNNNSNNFSGEGNDIALCDEDLYNCGDFSSQAQAQEVFDECISKGKGDIHQLDKDGNGKACESLD